MVWPIRWSRHTSYIQLYQGAIHGAAHWCSDARAILFDSTIQDDEMSLQNASTALYLDDLSVGQQFSSASLTVTADAIRAFAREFDPQPFHISEAAAEGTLFGRLAASGWHTAALTMRLNVEGGLPLLAGLSVPAVTWPGRRPSRRRYNPRGERGGRPWRGHGRGLIAASSRLPVERSIRMAPRCRSPR